jgi:membrane protein
MKLKAHDVKSIFKDTFSEWKEDKAPKLAAALSYYAVFSIGPLFLIAVGVASIFFGQSAAQEQIITQAKAFVGDSAAETISGLLRNFQERQAGGPAAIIGLVTLVIAATGVFAELQDSMNSIWEVKPAKIKGVGGIIKKRLLSFGMVLAIGFLLLISLIATTVLEGVMAAIVLPGGEFIWQAVSFAVTFGLITLLFASMFRYLPDAKIAWRDLWIGAALTALLFTLGKHFISLYLAKNATASAFGAAGSLVVLLLWVYYSAQIFFFGAEFTQTYANTYGSGIVPNEGATSTAGTMDYIHKRKEAMMKIPVKHAKGTNHKIKTFNDAITAVKATEQPLKNEIRKTRLTVANLMKAKKYYIMASTALAVISYILRRRKHAKAH